MVSWQNSATVLVSNAFFTAYSIALALILNNNDKIILKTL